MEIEHPLPCSICKKVRSAALYWHVILRLFHIITYIVGAYKIAQQLIGEDRSYFVSFGHYTYIIEEDMQYLYCCFMASNNASMLTSKATEKS